MKLGSVARAVMCIEVESTRKLNVRSYMISSFPWHVSIDMSMLELSRTLYMGISNLRTF
jgi:hypothetical protein